MMRMRPSTVLQILRHMINPLLIRNLALVLAVAFTVVACSSAQKSKKLIKGVRTPVLGVEKVLSADPGAENISIQLPQPTTNSTWEQPGGNIRKVMGHLTLSDQPKKVWSRNVGIGDSKKHFLISPPVVAENMIFTIDTRARVKALSLEDGKVKWSVLVPGPRKKRKKLAYGGGVSYGDGRIYAVSGFGTVAAYNAKDGTEIWTRELATLLRGGPVLYRDHIYITTEDNQVVALKASDGSELWINTGIVEDSSKFGIAAPSAINDSLLVGYSSGEVKAVNVGTGYDDWQDVLTSGMRLSAIASIMDIDASPVVEPGRVYVVSNGGHMVAYELSTGTHRWDREIASRNTPWLAGDYLFVVSIDSVVTCVRKEDGKIIWATQLQRYRKVKNKKGRVIWSGPILASDRLVLVSSTGYIASVSPYTGKLLSVDRLGKGSFLPPIVAQNNLILMNRDADIIVYR